jgi:hypothetical protein
VPRKVFVAGEILTAADLQANAVDQSVMVFDDAAARTTAIPSPIEGMVTYLKDTDKLEKYNGTAWVDAAPGKISQVVSVVKTDTFSTSLASNASTAITGLSASITPTSVSSKILVSFAVHGQVPDISGVEGQKGPSFILKRGATAIGIGESSGSRPRVTATINSAGAEQIGLGFMTFLDEPASTSSLTYSIDVHNSMLNTNTVSVNRSNTNPDNTSGRRPISTITLMEVAG